jgi:putative transposase
MAEDNSAPLTGAIRIDDQQLRGHIDEVVRLSVEETLNGLPDAEADDICRAQRYEHSPERVDTRASSTIPLRSRVSL